MPDVAVYTRRAKTSLQKDWEALLGRIITDPTARRNWRLCLVIQASWSWYLGGGFTATYYKDSLGFSQAQIFMLQITWASVFTAGTSLGGWLADRYGIRRVMLWGSWLYVVQAAFFAASSQFWQLEIVLLLAGVQGSLLGGSTDTFCTASLRNTVPDKDEREELYKRYQHVVVQVRAFLAPLAMVLGNYLWRMNAQWPFMLQVAINIVPLAAIYMATEPRTPALHLTRDIIRKRVRVLLWDRRDIRWAAAVFVITGASSIAGFWMTQPLMTNASISKDWFGWIAAAQSICIGLCSWVVRPLQKLKPVVMWGGLAVITSFASLGAGYGGAVGVTVVLVGYSLARAASAPFLSGHLYRALGENDETRATDISIIDSMQTAVFVVVGLAMAGVSTKVSTEVAFLVIGAVCAILSSIALLNLRKATRPL